MEEYLSQLNEMQLEAVMHEGSPLLILAGAGSGKTRVITTKIAYLIEEKKADPYSILAVTFTNKAAGEMYERVLRMSPHSKGVMIRTFHSFGAWLLRRNTHCAGLSSNFTIYDEEDMVTLLHGLYPDRTRSELKPYAGWISRAKDYGLHYQDDLYSISSHEDFPEVYESYQKKLEQIGSVDFGDLILKCVNILANYPEVKDRIQQRFSTILVDEYQDSNVAQFELLKQLKGDDSYLCVVGDDDQSIYRFRGAEVQNIIDFPNYFEGTTIVRLEQNYRSSENILAIASAVVDHNTGRLGKTLWTDKKGGRKGILKILEDQNQEAEYCASVLMEGDIGETAILYRTNAQSLSFESLFIRQGIPYRVVGALRFYEREEIKDALALLSFLINPRDEIAFKRMINKPARGLGKKSVSAILEHQDGTGKDLVEAGYAAAHLLSSKGGKALKGFMDTVRATLDLLGRIDLPAFIERVVTDFGLIEYHQKQDEVAGTQKILNLEELINAAADYPGNLEGLTLFVEHLELDRAQLAGQEDDRRERVTLITMHNTKGLEFKRVIITGLEEGLFPSLRDGMDEDIEEERRIFYVSITRAKEELYLTSCRRRRIWGRTMSFQPSRFLYEIPSDLLESGGFSGESRERDFSRGVRVFHEEYGPGVVYNVEYQETEEVVFVRFDTGFAARFIPRFSPLTVLG